MGFEFASFSNGPVADEMANGIYRLSDEDSSVYEAAAPDMPASFRTGEFLDLVSGRSAEWMCAAVTLLDMNIEYRKDMNRMKGKIKDMIGPSRSSVDDAFDEINKRGLIRRD